MVAFHKGNSDETVAADVLEFMEERLLDQPFFGYHEQVHRRVDLVEVDEGVDFFAIGQGQDIDGSNALRVTAVSFRNFISLQAIDAAEVGEEQDRIPCRCIEQVVYSVFILRSHALDTAASLVLRMVYIGVDALHVTPAGQRKDHAFVRNHVFDGKIRRIGYDLRAPFITEFFLSIEEFRLYDFHNFVFICQNATQVSNAFFQFRIFFFDFFAFQAGQSTQTHVEDGNGLFFAEAELAHQRLFGNIVCRRFTNCLDDFIDVVQSNEQAF